jgi:myo-inositol-1(or 4)-monophosphatase
VTDHAPLLPIAREAVASAHRIIRSRAPRSVAAKGDRDMVTDIDLAVEDAVRDFLSRETPEIGILGEEHGRTGSSDGALWWSLDPVDGTANLARGIPLCAVSLALVEGRRSVLAAIDLPFLEVGYTAAAGHGAYAGDERIRASGVRDLSEAVISIGDFAIGANAVAKNRLRIALLDRLGARAQRVRMIGTAAIDLTWVAHGKLDAAIILANRPWDTMAGVLLVHEAGGVVLDQDDTEHTADSSATIAVCAGLREDIMATLRQAHVDTWRPKDR